MIRSYMFFLPFRLFRAGGAFGPFSAADIPPVPPGFFHYNGIAGAFQGCFWKAENPAYHSDGKCGTMKMFNMINIGERSGSGVPLIFNTWEDQGWNEPLIEERFDPDRTILSLDFSPKQAKKNKRRKTGEENRRRKTGEEKRAKKTGEENRR